MGQGTRSVIGMVLLTRGEGVLGDAEAVTSRTIGAPTHLHGIGAHDRSGVAVAHGY